MYQFCWCVYSYHVYRNKWDTAVDEEMESVQGKNNFKDRHAIAAV